MVRGEDVRPEVLHVIVGYGLPFLYENTIRSVRKIVPREPLLVIDNASPDESLRRRLRQRAEADPAMTFVQRSENDLTNRKTGGLYDAYSVAFAHAMEQGYHYLHLMQADMQLLWWDHDAVDRAEAIYDMHPTCINICMVALSSDRGLAGELRRDPATGHTLLARYGLTDTGLFHLERWKREGGAFAATEEEHGSAALAKDWRVVVFSSPTEVQVPWPAVMRGGRQKGREVEPVADLLCVPLTEPAVETLKKAKEPVWLEELAIPWGWSCLSPMLNTDFDQWHYLALRRRAVVVLGVCRGLPRWERRGLDRRLDVIFAQRRPSLIALLTEPLKKTLRQTLDSVRRIVSFRRPVP